MYPLNQLKTLVSCGRDPARSLPFRRGFLLIPLMLVCFALSPQTQAVEPNTPDPGAKPVSNTADGQNSLASITTGIHNSAFGFDALLSDSNASFNTAVGSATLLVNNAAENTAVGTGALLLNTGAHNTAVGAFALIFNEGDPDPDTGQFGIFNVAVGANALLLNTTGSSNNAVGESALFNNTTGAANTAVGDVALASGAGDDNSFNTAVGTAALFGCDQCAVVSNSNNAVGAEALTNILDGTANNAMGVDALFDNQSGSGNVAIGDAAGAGVEGSFNIYIGFGVTGPGPEDNTIRIGDTKDTGCFIGGIANSTSAGDLVAVDADGHLGAAVAAGGGKVSIKNLLQQQQLVQELKATTERQAATIALQEAQIKTLTAGLKQQAEQIQKVSAQLEMIRPTPRVVENR